MKLIRFLSVLVCWTLVTTPVFAVPILEDVNPPSFRGEPNSVVAVFDLEVAVIGPPDEFTEGPGATYPLDGLIPFADGPYTNLDSSLSYFIELPNYIDQEPLKKIRVQYIYHTGNPLNARAWTEELTAPDGQFPPGINNGVLTASGKVTGIPHPSGNLHHYWEDFEIRPNPDNEFFEVRFINADPHMLIIDTISIPEPSSIVLFGLAGGLIFAMRRRLK